MSNQNRRNAAAIIAAVGMTGIVIAAATLSRIMGDEWYAQIAEAAAIIPMLAVLMPVVFRIHTEEA